jgi:hypothetical protein
MVVHKPREKLGMLIVFLLPLLLVKGGALFTGGGPGGASAATGPTPKPPIEVTPNAGPEWSDEQLAASAHINHLRSQPFGSSPLLHVAAPQIQPVVPDNPVPDTPVEVPPPDVNVKMILTRSDGNHIALIGRKHYRVGDAIGDPPWHITNIDGPARSVEIVHKPSERTATLMVPLPR